MSTSSSKDDFTTDNVKNDVTLYKLDVNVKNRTAIAGSVGCFKP